MKYLLFLVVALPAAVGINKGQRTVVKSILDSQRNTVEHDVTNFSLDRYELTRLTSESYAAGVIKMVDSAMKADGVTHPLNDSLHFMAAYYVAGYMRGAVWRDTTTYYEWGTSAGDALVRQRWDQLEGGWRQLINAAITWDKTYWEAIRQSPGLYEGHGYNTLYTRWYARSQPHKTHTIAFFLSAN